jgi:hypothetical protein
MNCFSFKGQVWLWVCCFCLLPLVSQAQREAYDLLMKPDAELRGDVLQTEATIDLVDAWVVDSIIDKRKQRLKGFGGWIAQRTWARYWLYFTDRKQKYVGSSSRPYHIYDGMADEMDINIFIMPHLTPYILMVRAGFDRARERPRPDKGFRFDAPEGFPLPPELKVDDLGYLTVECEVTPPQAFADTLEKMFAPMRKGNYRLDTISNFGTQHASFGMTGPWCMDCNHNCRPEIHPMEWIWWRDMSKDRPGSPNAKSWMASLMVDGSNRFKDWTPSPITGEIAIPFALPPTAKGMRVNLLHIASDPTENDSLFVPENAIQSGDTTFSFRLDYQPTDGHPAPTCKVQISRGWPSQGTRYWIDTVSEVEGGGLIGYFHVATSVTSLMAFRLTFDNE